MFYCSIQIYRVEKNDFFGFKITTTQVLIMITKWVVCFWAAAAAIPFQLPLYHKMVDSRAFHLPVLWYSMSNLPTRSISLWLLPLETLKGHKQLINWNIVFVKKSLQYQNQWLVLQNFSMMFQECIACEGKHIEYTTFKQSVDSNKKKMANTVLSYLEIIFWIGSMLLFFLNYSLSNYGQIVGQTRLFNLGIATNLGEGKLWIQISQILHKSDLMSHPAHAYRLVKCIFKFFFSFMRVVQKVLSLT